MALLDALNSMDPDQKSAIFQGLLAGGFGAMAGRGTALQAWGQGGLAGLNGYSGALDNQLQNRMRQQQMQRGALQDKLLQGQISEQQAGLDQKLAQQNWLKNLQSPQQQASSAALSGGGGPTVENAQKMAPVDPYQQMLFEATKSGALPIQSYMASMQKDSSPLAVPDGTVMLDRKTMKPIFENMKADKATQPEIQKLLALRTMYPEGSPDRTAIEAAINKATTHTPAASITNYGSPVPIDLGGGRVGYAQPPNKAGAAPQVMNDPKTGLPLTKPAEVKPLPEAAQKQVIGARNLQDAIDKYQTTLATWEKRKMLDPNARAEMGNAYNNMMLQGKEAYNLGVLNGPDYDILQSVVKDPTKTGSLMVNNKTLSNQAGSLKGIAKNIERTVLETHGREYTDRSPEAYKKQVKRTGTYQGRKVIEYADGTTEFQN